MLAAKPKCPLCRRDIQMHELRNGITAAEADTEEAAAEAAAADAAAAAAAAAAGPEETGKGKGQAAAGEGDEDEEREGGEGAVPAAAEGVHVSESKLVALLKEVGAAGVWWAGPAGLGCWGWLFLGDG